MNWILFIREYVHNLVWKLTGYSKGNDCGWCNRFIPLGAPRYKGLCISCETTRSNHRWPSFEDLVEAEGKKYGMK